MGHYRSSRLEFHGRHQEMDTIKARYPQAPYLIVVVEEFCNNVETINRRRAFRGSADSALLSDLTVSNPQYYTCTTAATASGWRAQSSAAARLSPKTVRRAKHKRSALP
jgi:hypothetical protein